MNFFKKIGFLTCMSIGIPAIAQETKIENDYTAIVHGLYKTFEADVDRIETELTRIDQIEDEEEYTQEIDKLIKQKLEIVKPKFTVFFHHELTEQQRVLLLQLLTDIRDLTSTTAEEF